jgi:hypothetical protein
LFADGLEDKMDVRMRFIGMYAEFPVIGPTQFPRLGTT